MFKNISHIGNVKRYLMYGNASVLNNPRKALFRFQVCLLNYVMFVVFVSYIFLSGVLNTFH